VARWGGGGQREGGRALAGEAGGGRGTEGRGAARLDRERDGGVCDEEEARDVPPRPEAGPRQDDAPQLVRRDALDQVRLARDGVVVGVGRLVMLLLARVLRDCARCAEGRERPPRSLAVDDALRRRAGKLARVAALERALRAVGRGAAVLGATATPPPRRRRRRRDRRIKARAPLRARHLGEQARLGLGLARERRQRVGAGGPYWGGSSDAGGHAGAGAWAGAGAAILPNLAKVEFLRNGQAAPSRSSCSSI